MDDKTRELLVFAVIGIVAGFLASVVVGGGGLIQYLVSGVIGAFVGGYLLRALGVNLGIGNALASHPDSVMLLLDLWPLRRLELDAKPLNWKASLPLLREKIPFLALAFASCSIQ